MSCGKRARKSKVFLYFAFSGVKLIKNRICKSVSFYKSMVDIDKAINLLILFKYTYKTFILLPFNK